MQRMALAGLTILALLGVGCPSRPTVSSEPVLSEAERATLQDGARNTMASGAAERLADFQGGAHHAEGMARIVRKNEKLYVVLDDTFAVDAGPQLSVFASGSSNPANETDLRARGAWELGRLQSTSGIQSYALPSDINIDSVKSIVILSKLSDAIFAVASIQ